MVLGCVPGEVVYIGVLAQTFWSKLEVSGASKKGESLFQ
jgi:hypothetical protein